MIVGIGNLLFHHRNALFPVFYLALFVPSALVLDDYVVAFLIGLVLALLGQGVRAVTIGLEYVVRGGKNQRIYAEDLVTDGIFAHCRNPMYVGNLLVLAGLGMMANSALFMIVVVPLFVFFYYAIVRAEEDFLGRQFGESFDAYKSVVPRWLPRLAGLSETLAGSRFQWGRVLRKEYGSAYLWMTGAVLLLLKNARAVSPALLADLLPYGILAGVLLLSAYLTVRYLKKAGRLRDV